MARVPTALTAQTFKLSSHSQSFKLSQTLTLKVSEKKEKEKKKTLTLTLTYIGGRGLSSAAALSLIGGNSRWQRLSPFTPIHGTLFLSLSLSIGLPLIVSAENPN